MSLERVDPCYRFQFPVLKSRAGSLDCLIFFTQYLKLIHLMPASSDSQNSSPHTLEAVTPVDIVRGHNYPLEMASPPVSVPQAGSSSDTRGPSLKSPRTGRFAEATSVQSPVEHTESSASPFADPPIQSQSQHDVSVVGFGYVSANDPARHASHFPPPASPLKSALKTPGTPGRALNPLSPTFREEYFAEKHEKVAEKENARDIVSEHQIHGILNPRRLYFYLRKSSCVSEWPRFFFAL